MTLSLNPYPEYKESGLSWLGTVPAHWDVRRSKYVFREVDVRSATGQEVHLSMSQKRGLIPSSQIGERRLLSETYVGAKLCEPYDVILNRLKAHLGVFALARQRGLVSPDYTVYRPRPECSPRYFVDVLRTPLFRSELRKRAKGIVEGFWRLYTEDFYQILLPVPPPSEQKRIADFLDTYGRIVRCLIRAKLRLIELLNEQKQAIIHHVVTRGLDPDVRMKPSGIVWLGDVPEHWCVHKLRHIAQLLVSNVDKHTIDSEIPVRLCNYTDVYKNEFISPEIEFMKATASGNEIETFRIKIGDVLITKDSELWNDIGVPSFVIAEAADLICGYHLAIIRPRPERINGMFLHRMLQNKMIATQFHASAKGVTRFGLSQGPIKDVLLPVPPLDEQAAIVETIAESLHSINLVIKKERRQLDLIREYRTCLIADIVTGKLDVRGVKLEEVEGEADFLEDLEGNEAGIDSDKEIDAMEGLNE